MRVLDVSERMAGKPTRNGAGKVHGGSERAGQVEVEHDGDEGLDGESVADGAVLARPDDER